MSKPYNPWGNAEDQNDLLRDPWAEENIHSTLTEAPQTYPTSNDKLGFTTSKQYTIQYVENNLATNINLDNNQNEASPKSVIYQTDSIDGFQRHSSNNSIELESGKDVDPLGALLVPSDMDTNNSTSDTKQKSEKETSDQQKNVLEVSLLEPLKVGGDLLLSGHVEYRLKTVTSLPLFRNKECSVMRRYSDFLWLYSLLICGIWEPGYIVPGVPSKQAVGRFETEFIEFRRRALERWIKKVVEFKVWRDLECTRFFLESETFQNDKKSWALERNLSSISILPFTEYLPLTTSAAFPSLPSSTIKLNPELPNIRDQLVNLDSNLISLYSALEGVGKSCLEVETVSVDLESVFTSLSIKITDSTLKDKLEKVSNIHRSLKSFSEGETGGVYTILLEEIDDFNRWLGSIKLTFSVYTRMYDSLINSEKELDKAKNGLEKYKGASVRTDKIGLYNDLQSRAQEEVEKKSKELKMCGEKIVESSNTLLKKKLGECLGYGLTQVCKTILDRKLKELEVWKGYYSSTSVQPSL